MGFTMGEGSDFFEKRADRRFPVNIPLTYTDLNNHRKAEACTRDISAQGLCMLVEADEDFNPGVELEICLQMTDNAELIYLKGRVVWSGLVVCDKQRVGILLEGQKLKVISLVLRILKSQKTY